MFGLLGVTLGFTALLVFGVLAGVFALVFGLITLPFRILGLGIRLVLGLLFLPILFVLGIIGVGFGLVGLLLPVMPLLLIVAGIVWLTRRGRRSHVVGGARV